MPPRAGDLASLSLFRLLYKRGTTSASLEDDCELNGEQHLDTGCAQLTLTALKLTGSSAHRQPPPFAHLTSL